MYRKVLVPLDGSIESEKVINSIQDVLNLESEVILLKVIPPMSGQRLGEVLITAGEREESERVKEMSYLRTVIRRFGARADQFRCEVIVSKSVAEGITGVAAQEKADLIAMYTHGRKGLARLVKGSIAAKVERGAPLKCVCLNRQSLLTLEHNRFVATLEYAPFSQELLMVLAC